MTQSTSSMPVPGDRAAVDVSHLSDLETALSASELGSQALLDDARDCVEKIHGRVSHAMGKGAGPAEFAVLEAVARACEAAGQVLDATIARSSGNQHFR